MNELLVLINEEGQLLEIDPKVTDEDSILVPLQGYYEVFNEQRYPQARWDFDLKMWVGVGEKRPLEPIQPSDIDILKADNEMLKLMVADLGLMVGGGL